MASRTLIFSLSPSFPSTAIPSTSLRRFILPVVSSGGDFLCPRYSSLKIRSSTLVRSFSTRPTTSSLNDPSPNWSNQPPKETILLDGCDFEHWLCVMEPPDANWTRDRIIDHYIKTLAQVVGSEGEARMKIYSVSTKHYFAFGANVSEEVSYKLKELPGMRWVLPDSYMDVKNKEYGAIVCKEPLNVQMLRIKHLGTFIYATPVPLSGRTSKDDKLEPYVSFSLLMISLANRICGKSKL